MNKYGVLRLWSQIMLVLSCIFLTACSAELSAGGSPDFTIAGGGGTDGSATNQGAGGNPGSGGITAGPTYTGGGGAGSSTIGTIGPGNIGDICAGVTVKASRVKPWVLFVVDRSGSTKEEYPGSTSKWQAMYDALMAPSSGLINKLQSVAYFGMLLYDGGEQIDPICILLGNCPDGGASTCPRLVTVEPALNNFKAIDAKYSQSPPGGSTPSALALAAAYKLVPAQSQKLDEEEIGPQFVIYCTDGEPNGCEGGGRGRDSDPAVRQAVVDEVTAAAKANIQTYVIGMAVEAAAQTHLDDLAKAGNTGAPAFSPATKDDLVNVLSQIVGGAIGCKLKLNNTVSLGKECSGYVYLNSVPLACNDPNGWKLADESHIELQGNACKSFMNDPKAMLDAGFPCDALVLQ